MIHFSHHNIKTIGKTSGNFDLILPDLNIMYEPSCKVVNAVFDKKLCLLT